MGDSVVKRCVRAVLVAAWTAGLIAVGYLWPWESAAVSFVVLAVAGVWWWRSLDRLVEDYVKRHDRRPR